MTREERRARREITQKGRHARIVKSKRAKRCTCGTGACFMHGRFEPGSQQ